MNSLEFHRGVMYYVIYTECYYASWIATYKILLIHVLQIFLPVSFKLMFLVSIPSNELPNNSEYDIVYITVTQVYLVRDFIHSS